MDATIPCRRPKVEITTETVASGPLAHRATCHVTGCAWGYGPAVKTDAEQHATWHRQAHRAAVPSTGIRQIGRDHEASCACGEEWLAPTRAHAKTWLRHHLELDHGLVNN